MWQHNYEPLSGSLGGSAVVAAVPIFVLFLMLGVFRRPAWMSAVAALISALLISLVIYGMPLNLALISVIYGAAFGLFPIAWICVRGHHALPPRCRYRKFEIIKDSGWGLSNDRRLQAMFIAFLLRRVHRRGSGVSARRSRCPVRCSAGLGFNPFYAAGICLLANTAPVAFGSIGIPVTTLANITAFP
jgi:lactate permease